MEEYKTDFASQLDVADRALVETELVRRLRLHGQDDARAIIYKGLTLIVRSKSELSPRSLQAIVDFVDGFKFARILGQQRSTRQ